MAEEEGVRRLTDREIVELTSTAYRAGWDKGHERGYEHGESSQFADWDLAFDTEMGLSITGPMHAMRVLKARDEAIVQAVGDAFRLKQRAYRLDEFDYADIRAAIKGVTIDGFEVE